MKNSIRVLAISQVLLISLQSGIADSPSLTREDRYLDFKLFQSVSTHAVNWLSYASKCDEGINKMLVESNDEVSSHFIAAKLSWIGGRPSKAIAILEKLIRDNGQSRSPDVQLPVAIVGNLWIGTISRHCGDAQRGKKAYGDVLKIVKHDEKHQGNAAFCYLYQAEIESSILGNKEAALKALQRIEPIAHQYETEDWKLFQEWAEYRSAVLTKGVKEARADLRGSSQKTESSVMLVMTQLGVGGIAGEPRADFYIGPSNSRKVILEAALRLAVDCRTSPIDRGLAQFFLGYASAGRREMEKAEMYYGDLFAGESFFAPEGGILLAKCQKKQGKVEKSNKTFAKVKQLFPGYRHLVDQLTQ
jgi:tetratricopeptide (TPR) repeat protein